MALTPVTVKKGNVTSGPSHIYINSVDIGATQGAVKWRKNFETLPVECEQEKDAFDMRETGCSFSLNFAAEERTIAMLCQWLDNAETVQINKDHTGSADLTKDTQHFGYDNSTQAITPITVDIVGPAPGGGDNATTHFYRCYRTGTREYSSERKAITVLPFELRCLPDISKAAGRQYGYCEESKVGY